MLVPLMPIVLPPAIPPVSVPAVDPAVQLMEGVGVALFTIPEGYVSVKPTPVTVAVLLAGLVMTIDNVDVPPTGIGLGLNDFVTVGGHKNRRCGG